MINKSNLSLWIFCVCFVFYKEGAKLNDENRPYEFGFTIDGQQHRHERKDANGIVQGEFGFITADGVYHVTVYATDENGRFKILSMRNIKISEPLDGLQVGSYTTKPLPIGESISSTSSGIVNVNQNIGLSTSTSLPKPVVIGNVQNVEVNQGGSSTVISTTKKPSLSTTQSTIKQACAGCGYATKVSSSTPKSESLHDKLNGNIGGTSSNLAGDQNLNNQNFGNQQSNIATVDGLGGPPVASYTTKPLQTSQSVSSTSSTPINVNQNVGFSTSTSVSISGLIENIQNVEVANLGEVSENPAITNQGGSNKVVSTTRKPILFTTQSTIKPACASCGYVTRVSSSTPKSEPTLDSNQINLQNKQNGYIGGPPGKVAGGYSTGPQTITSNENQNLGNQQSIGTQQNKIPTVESGANVQNMHGYQSYSSGGTNQNTPQAFITNDNQIGSTPSNVGNQSSVSSQHTDTQSDLNAPNKTPFNQKQPQTFNENQNQNYQASITPNQNQFDAQNNLGSQNMNIANQDNKNVQYPMKQGNQDVSYPGNQGNQNIPYLANQGNANVPSPGNQESQNVPYPGNQDNQNIPYQGNQGNQNVPYPDNQRNQNVPSSGNQNIPYSGNQGNQNILNQNGPGEIVPNQMMAQDTSLPNQNQIQMSQIPSTNLQSQMDQAVSKPHSIVDDIKIENNAILVPNNPPIPIKDKYPGMKDGLPNGITPDDISDLLYKFNYTIGFHGHYEMGWKNGTKTGGYFVNGRDGISRVVTYVADELGYRPKFKLINLGYDSPLTPKEETEKSFGLQSFEFVWYPLK